MKNLRYISILFFILFFVSCDKFEEINTNPDTTTKVTPGMLATQVLTDTYRFYKPNSSDFVIGNLFNKHIVAMLADVSPSQYYYSLNPYGSFDNYLNLTDLNDMIQFSEGLQYEPSYKGLKLFLKAWYGFKNTIDMGDVPYSEAGLANEGITKPKYDKQVDVFAEILSDLKEAEAYFAEGFGFDGDIMYNGDAAKWRKLCNLLQLKIIQTISKKATSVQKARFAEIVNEGILMESNADDLKLVYTTSSSSQHPMINGEIKRLYTAISKLAVDALKNFNDRRLFYFAEPAQVLIDQGMKEDDYDAYLGAPSSLSPSTLELNGLNGEYSLINKRYVDFKDGEPMLYLTYSEQCFILAEAVEEGWISGNAKTYYENGVKSILSYYMNLPHTSGYVHNMAIDQTYIDNYFTSNAAYAIGGTKTDRLHQIWMQRWLLDFFQGNGGNYAQFLRNGYPIYPLDPLTSKNPDDPTQYPKRWKYPASELNTNPENYKKALDEQYGGYDGINQVPWWLK